nr:unnamed protein product [Digitaria exilis]
MKWATATAYRLGPPPPCSSEKPTQIHGRNAERKPQRPKASIHETLVGVEPPFRAAAAAAKFFRRNRMILVEGRGGFFSASCRGLGPRCWSRTRRPRSKIFSTGPSGRCPVAVGKLTRPMMLYPRTRRADGWGDRVHETDSESNGLWMWIRTARQLGN